MRSHWVRYLGTGRQGPARLVRLSRLGVQIEPSGTMPDDGAPREESLMERLNSLVKEASETRYTGRGDQRLKAGLFEEWGL